MHDETNLTDEAHRHAIERGEDVVYVLNHATACTFLDFFNTFVEYATKRFLGAKLSISHCAACEAGVEHGSVHAKQLNGEKIKAFGWDIGRWVVCEQIGDWMGAIPTLLMQRHTPMIMDGIGQACTYVVGDLFYAGAQKDATTWGEKHGFAQDSEEVKNRQREIYTHEIKHVAQAVVWTGWSTAITLGSLRLLKDETPIMVNAAAKVAGMATSLIGVLGTRAFNPEAARNWDRWGSEHIAEPATRILSGLLGIKNDTVEHVFAEQKNYREGSRWLHTEKPQSSWTQRIHDEQATTEQSRSPMK
ncbi:MAG: hypothetical protein EAY65_01500 [Alphaproteobacteria bacterium]|nr:MAG: hypothetical protein EAY65_01500 [Alphaproteobacteria bacterium]